MWIEIEALDTLFFKDGKPFSMGEETWADGIFPPAPSVVHGALRSAYMSQINQSVTLANEPGDQSKKLSIENYCLSINNFLHYPLPLDLVLKKRRTRIDKIKEQNDNQYYVHLLKLKENKFFSSHSKIPFLLTHDEEVERIEGGYIEKTELESYLACENESFSAKKIGQIVTEEPKVGIGRNDLTSSAQESKLYRVGMKRLNGIDLAVKIAGIDKFETKGLLKLGGEAKAARYLQVDFKEVDQPEKIKKRFKLYLATPALLKKGWIPEWLDELTLKGIYPNTNIQVQMISAAIGKPIAIGGFDMKKKKPKPMLQSVPAGSVYYFEIVGDYPESELIQIKPIKLCEYTERMNEGFGITFIGDVE